MKKVRVVSLAWETPTVLLFIPTKYESNPLKNKGNITLKKVNQKVNLGRRPPARPTPTCPDIAILKDGFFEKPIQVDHVERD